MLTSAQTCTHICLFIQTLTSMTKLDGPCRPKLLVQMLFSVFWNTYGFMFTRNWNWTPESWVKLFVVYGRKFSCDTIGIFITQIFFLDKCDSKFWGLYPLSRKCLLGSVWKICISNCEDNGLGLGYVQYFSFVFITVSYMYSYKWHQ
jgi:hypothetical protein